MKPRTLTTNPLSANAVYTSPTFDTFESEEIKNIGILAFSDQSGTLAIEMSIDGENWDYSSTFSLTGGSALAVSSEIVARYIRVKYTNGSVDQTVFRLGVRFY